jgi:hypothetical protein
MGIQQKAQEPEVSIQNCNFLIYKFHRFGIDVSTHLSIYRALAF